MDVVAGKTGDAVRVHGALHEIVALHAVLVRGAIGEMREGGFAELVFFELPEIAQVLARFITDGPIVIDAVDGLLQGLALRVALDAGVGGGDRIEARGIDDGRARGAGDVIAAGTVATFAADVPLGDGVGFDVVVHGMAAVAESAGGALHVVGGIEAAPTSQYY